jgi:formiminoglutamase
MRKRRQEKSMTEFNEANWPWKGRVEQGEPMYGGRWHQHVRPFHADATGGVTLIGFPVDEGVRRNQGRTGAAAGPVAIRQLLGNMPMHVDQPIWDAGNVPCHDDRLEDAQWQLASKVSQAINRNALPIVMGGGHEVALGTYLGIRSAYPALQDLLILNLDAHFDLRDEAERTSGTSFLDMWHWSESRSMPFHYSVYGISRFANTRGLFARADKLGVSYVFDENMQSTEQVQIACDSLAARLASLDAVYLTICLDVLAPSYAPGVSAPAALGVPLFAVEMIVDLIVRSGKLIAADVAELNPRFDSDSRTARTAARLIAKLAQAAPYSPGA